MAPPRLILLAVAILAGACASERVHTMSFASLGEARQAGAVERTWVPSFVPENAYELRAAYEPSGWRRWGILNFDAKDPAPLRAVVEANEISLEGTRMDIPGRIEWWPVALRGDLDHQALEVTGLRAHRVKDLPYVVAVNWSQGRAYYWATGP